MPRGFIIAGYLVHSLNGLVGDIVERERSELVAGAAVELVLELDPAVVEVKVLYSRVGG